MLLRCESTCAITSTRSSAALAAHRSQYPIDVDAFPRSMLEEMYGVEYFLRREPRSTAKERRDRGTIGRLDRQRRDPGHDLDLRRPMARQRVVTGMSSTTWSCPSRVASSWSPVTTVRFAKWCQSQGTVPRIGGHHSRRFQQAWKQAESSWSRTEALNHLRSSSSRSSIRARPSLSR